MSTSADALNPGLWQRLMGLLGRKPAETADVLPVRVGGTEYRQTAATPVRVHDFDQALLWVVVALLAFGVVMVYSASIAMPDNPRFGKISATHFLNSSLVHSNSLSESNLNSNKTFLCRKDQDQVLSSRTTATL